MSLIDLLLAASLTVYPLFVLAERAWPAREQPQLRGWALTGIGFFVAFMATSVLLPLALPPSWFEASLLLGAELGIAGGTVVGYLATTFAGYVWHRAAHAVPLLWRVFHQMHHAPRRLDAVGAFVFHPSEAALYTLLGAALNVIVLGLDPVAASIVGFLGAFNAVFQHANLRIASRHPFWRAWGRVLNNPHFHAWHHTREGHLCDGNYGNTLTIWDRLFGSEVTREEAPAQLGLASDQALSESVLGLQLLRPRS